MIQTTTISESGLGKDLFRQFVNHDPISPAAKVAFTERFPDLLAGRIEY